MIIRKLLLGTVFSLLSISVCAGQTEGSRYTFEIGQADSREEIFVNTGKRVANIAIPDINKLYNIPETIDKGVHSEFDLSDEEEEFLLSRTVKIVANNLKEKYELYKRKEQKVGEYIAGEREIWLRVDLQRGVLPPGINILIVDCEESGHTNFMRMTIEYYSSVPPEDKWKISSKKYGDMNSLPDAGLPECFSSEEIGLDNRYEKIEHGDHYHYVPENRNPDVPVSRFSIEAPEEGEYITPSGEVVEKEQ